MNRLGKVWTWIDSRLALSEVVGPMLFHPVPRNARWWYVFGSATMTLLMVQLFTGVLLATMYVPSAEGAHASLVYMTDPAKQPLGWFIRALHFYSASGMVVMMVLHMTQVFLFGAYKYPREMTWMVGVILFLLTLGLAFSGQVLRWDQDAYWGVGVATAAAGRIPIIGPQVVQFVLGGPIIGGAT
ncbi:MAG: cytochrome bc complex cytochrome b subunit, partial [Gemmataceae bacterium]